MGEHTVAAELDAENLRIFMQKVLTDLRALQRLIDDGQIESGMRRIGAEQELFLVDHDRNPAPVALSVIEEVGDPHFTTELGRFNLEFNLDPIELSKDCLRHLQQDLDRHLGQVREAAETCDAEVLLTGILPTLSPGDLRLENMTPVPRYFALNEAMQRLRGGEFQFRVKGIDEVTIKHDSVMLEACNTSFQVHFQVAPHEFARLYNIAQAVAAPVLAAATNSPLLFGKRLWRETRIALFQQSIDTRLPTYHIREQSPRVSFGRRWVRESVLEIFKEDIARFRVLLGAEIDEDPFTTLGRGEVPKLSALRLHNSTIYRWNRPCYGISEGKPHLRIENRVLPSGPTPVDEVANAAFWFGLINGVAASYDDITRAMDFDTARENFLAAARIGLQAQFCWPGHKAIPAQTLILEELLPLARSGLEQLAIDSGDIDKYLGVIEERVDSMQTGSQWLLDSLAAMRADSGKPDCLVALTSAVLDRERDGEPVHRWTPARLEESGGWEKHHARIGQFMTTDLFTVNQDELVDLVACLMDWEHIRHVPVEDNSHRLVGLVTYRALLRLFAQGRFRNTDHPIPVSDIMHRDLVTATPETTTLEAIALMKEHSIGCLPVCNDGRLVGIVTERDLMNLAAQLIEEELERG